MTVTGLIFFLFYSDPSGNDPISRAYFWNGLVQPPTSFYIANFAVWWSLISSGGRCNAWSCATCILHADIYIYTSFNGMFVFAGFPKKEKNYFTSSDPHHDMLGGGCQVRVVIENMMGRMENLKTLISGFLGLVIPVRWALVTMFLSWTTQTGCRIHRTYVSLIGSGEGIHTTHLLKCVLLLSTSQTDWKQSSDVLSDVSFDILSDKSSDISSDILSDISSDILSDISFDISFWQIFWHSFWHIFWHSFWHIFRHAFGHIFWHSFWHIKTKT